MRSGDIVTITKRESFRGKYFIVTRREKDKKVISRIKYTVSEKTKERISLSKKGASIREKTDKYSKSIKKQLTKVEKSLNVLEKNVRPIIELNRRGNKVKRIRAFTNVFEIQTRRFITGRRGIMQIKFLFTKIGRRGGERTAKRTGRSGIHKKKSAFPRDLKRAFNECYQRALAQIGFSPDVVEILDKRFIYWLPIKK